MVVLGAQPFEKSYCLGKRLDSLNRAVRHVDGGLAPSAYLGHVDALVDQIQDQGVVATGRGEFAEIILDIAFRNGVKVRRDADLAEILATMDLDSEIPVEAIIAVAEILRYIYAANQTGPWEPDGSASPIL